VVVPGCDKLPEIERHVARTTEVLQDLHDAYTFKVNGAVEADCWDDVADLTDDFVAESMALMVARAKGGRSTPASSS
jgi:hypothetical protein